MSGDRRGEPLAAGKLDPALLARVLPDVTSDPRVILGPGVGLDCAVLDAGGGRCLVAKSDPITFATDEIGWYAVHVNANDIATTGAEPRYFLATVLLPEGRADEALVESLFAQIGAACAEVGCLLVGGHTEVTIGLERPIVAGTMLGEVERSRLVLPTGARPGDVILLTKRIAVEATAILAREKAAVLSTLVAPDVLERAQRFLHEPGISVLGEARAATGAAAVRAMHDPTEGGVATGLRELAAASGVGLEIDGDGVACFPETRAVCDPFGIDPWGVIASGSLLIVVAPEDEDAVARAVETAGIEIARIGRCVAPGRGLVRVVDGVAGSLAAFERDEIVKAFTGSAAELR